MRACKPSSPRKARFGGLFRFWGGNFHTVGGFVLASLGHIPRKAERFTWADWEFEVVDVDRNRVDQVLASQVSDQPPPAATG
jgi:CBS domain containing-hemolysin-like protein